MRAAVLGCGMIGAGTGDPHPDVGVMTHCGAYVAHPETELVAVADPERADAAAARWGGRPYTDPLALLEHEQPEIVSVATPDHTHAELVAACLRTPSVKAVLAEKPLALSLSEARALVEAAQGRVLAVNYTRRFAPAFQRLAGELGEIQHVSGVYVKGLKHNGTHWLDLLRLLAGEPTVAHGWDRLHEAGEDPSLDAELTLANGAGVRLAALDTTRFTAFEMDLVTHRRPRPHPRRRARDRALPSGRRRPESGLSRAGRATARNRHAARRHAARRQRCGALRQHGRDPGVQWSGRGQGPGIGGIHPGQSGSTLTI